MMRPGDGDDESAMMRVGCRGEDEDDGHGDDNDDNGDDEGEMIKMMVKMRVRVG